MQEYLVTCNCGFEQFEIFGEENADAAVEAHRNRCQEKTPNVYWCVADDEDEDEA